MLLTRICEGHSVCVWLMICLQIQHHLIPVACSCAGHRLQWGENLGRHGQIRWEWRQRRCRSLWGKCCHVLCHAVIFSGRLGKTNVTSLWATLLGWLDSFGFFVVVFLVFLLFFHLHYLQYSGNIMEWNYLSNYIYITVYDESRTAHRRMFASKFLISVCSFRWNVLKLK